MPALPHRPWGPGHSKVAPGNLCPCCTGCRSVNGGGLLETLKHEALGEKPAGVRGGREGAAGLQSQPQEEVCRGPQKTPASAAVWVTGEFKPKGNLLSPLTAHLSL